MQFKKRGKHLEPDLTLFRKSVNNNIETDFIEFHFNINCLRGLISCSSAEKKK